MKYIRFFGNSNDSAGRETLRRAVRATRRTAGEATLSADARARILDAARSQADPAAGLFPSLFTPPRRMLAAGALPLVLAAGLLVLLNQLAPVAPEVTTSTVQVSKQDGRVFFRIANGSRDHTVYRSTDPHRFDRSEGVTVTDGAFTDVLHDQADLVFYRFD